MAGPGPALQGFLMYLVVAAAPTLLLWGGLRVVPSVYRRLVDVRRRRRAADQPVGPPIESAVANLRRLRREVRGRVQPNQVRQVALLAAYDETLLQVCRCVGVDAPLADAAGPDRAFARLLTEAAVENAGILLDPPGSNPAATRPDE